MPRPKRPVAPGFPHHITQRGNYQQRTFLRNEDASLYMDLLKQHTRTCGISVQGYCLMPNHVHLILTPFDTGGLGHAMQLIQSEFSRAVNLKMNRRGHLWQGRYHSVPLDEEHFWNALVYVELNPVRANLCPDATRWPWSSATAHCEESDWGFLDLSMWLRRYSGDDWKLVLERGLEDAALVKRIREATLRNWPLGNEGFLRELELRCGIKARPGKPGPSKLPRKPILSSFPAALIPPHLRGEFGS
jgi:putative transposase